MTAGSVNQLACGNSYIPSAYTESMQKLHICTITYTSMPGFSFFFKSPFAPENIKRIFLHYYFCYTISIERRNSKRLPVLHERSSQRTLQAAIRTRTVGSQRSRHFKQFNQSMCILSELSATRMVVYSQQWLQCYSKQTIESKKVFSYQGNVRYGKNNTINYYFFLFFRWVSVVH